MWLRLRMMVWKEFVQIGRDYRMLAVVIGLPVMMLLIYGYAINLDVRNIPMGVMDQDRSQASRELIGAFTNSGFFTMIGSLGSPREIDAALNSGRIRLALVIPPTLSRDLASGQSAQVQLLVDGSDSTTGSTTLGYVRGIVQQHSVSISFLAIRRGGKSTDTFLPIENHQRFWYNPELRSTNFIIPGLIAVILMMLAALLTSVTVVRERERGTIESLIVSPVRPVEVIVGKLIPYVIIAFCDVILVVVVAVFVFKVPLVGNPLYVLLPSTFFLVAALGMGLLISTVSKTQQLAMMAALMATQLPSVLLSGFIFPVSSMPKAIEIFSNIIPARHFITILRGVFLKGNGIAEIWVPSLLLLLLGIALVGLSTSHFQKKL